LDVVRAGAGEGAIKAIGIVNTVGLVQVVGAEAGARLEVISVDDIVCAVDIVGVHSGDGVVAVIGIVHVVGIVRMIRAEGGGIQVRGTVNIVRIVNAELDKRIMVDQLG
jgi:hypothetical protein